VPVQILCLSIEAIQQMLNGQPSWQKNLSTLLLWNAETALRTTIDLLIRNPQARVSARLLTLCGVRQGYEIPKGPVEPPLTQDQFAGMCGLSRKSVQRALSNLESEGLCENHYGRIVMSSAEALENSLMSLGSRSE